MFSKLYKHGGFKIIFSHYEMAIIRSGANQIFNFLQSLSKVKKKSSTPSLTTKVHCKIGYINVDTL